MNVVRDLRNTITHLQAELLRKQQQFTIKKQQYQDLINELQSDNNRLKMLLQEESLVSNTKQMQSKADFGKKDISISKQYEESVKDGKIWISTQEYSSLINENIFLKNQISEISATYQRQIDQITYYFDKIKHENTRLLPTKAHFSGQIKYIQQVLNSYVKDNQTEKQKYKGKLMEYCEMLQQYQNSDSQKQEVIALLKNKLDEQNQEMRILKRLSA